MKCIDEKIKTKQTPFALLFTPASMHDVTVITVED